MASREVFGVLLCAIKATDLLAKSAAAQSQSPATATTPATTPTLRPPLPAAPPVSPRPFLGFPGSANPLPQHGNINGGVDRGFNDVGIIYAARLYTGDFVDSIAFAWYVPSN